MDVQPARRKFNWWMVAFFIALLGFEVAREHAVVQANTPLAGDGLHVFGTTGYASAKGQWFRSDGGSQIVPGTVAISCYKEWNACVESQTMFFDTGVKWATTDLTLFEATEFTNEAVAYVNDEPFCATYLVRIDLVQKRVTATRDRKPGVTKGACPELEDRVAMELGDGPKKAIYDKAWMGNHFLPIFNTIRSL